jgi:hypothetical protein
MIWVANHRLQPESSDYFGFAGVLVNGPDFLAVSESDVPLGNILRLLRRLFNRRGAESIPCQPVLDDCLPSHLAR